MTSRSVFILFLSVIWSANAFALSPKKVYKKSSPAVVLILGSDNGRTGNGGTGSIITSEGKIITNAHVVINEKGKPYKVIYIFLKPPKISGDNARDLVNRYKAKVLSFSPANQLDLAVLQIETPPPNLPTIAFANPDHVDIGDEVVAIGHPEQGGLWTLTTGTISTLIANFNRIKGKNVFQTEASVNRGNSGGPLLDVDGNMVGINTMIARQGAGGVTITDINFALKSSVAVNWLAGQGMGLAYSTKKKKEEQVVVALAPQAESKMAPPVARSESPRAKIVVEAEPETAKPIPVQEVPPATIVVVDKPPKKSAKVVREEGRKLGTKKAKEKVVSGKRLDPKKAKPKYHTKKRKYSLDDLRRQQMKELEDIMDESRKKIRGKKSHGMGLW